VAAKKKIPGRVLTKKKVIEMMKAAEPGAAALHRRMKRSSVMSWRLRNFPLRGDKAIPGVPVHMGSRQQAKALAEDAAGRRVVAAAERAEHGKFLKREHGAGGKTDPNVQALFQRMADAYHGKVVLEHWYDDGSARILFEDYRPQRQVLGEQVTKPIRTRRRISIVQGIFEEIAKLNVGDSPTRRLVKVERIQKGRDPRPFFVSNNAHAVIAVAEL